MVQAKTGAPPSRGCVRAFSQYREAESPRCGERAAARKRRGRASGTQVRAEHSKEGAAGNFFVRPPTRHAPYRIPAVGGVATALPLPASYAQVRPCGVGMAVTTGPAHPFPPAARSGGAVSGARPAARPRPPGCRSEDMRVGLITASPRPAACGRGKDTAMDHWFRPLRPPSPLIA